MSRAFVKESDQDPEVLPERFISEYPNFVTPDGYAQIEAKIVSLDADRSAARERDDAASLARIARDLRYWTQRQATARVVQPIDSPDTVRFGVKVTLEFSDGVKQVFRLVGEDQADPARGLLSWTSPLGSAAIGAKMGDLVHLLQREAEVIAIEG